MASLGSRVCHRQRWMKFDLEDGSLAMVFQLEAYIVVAILLEQTDRLTAGTRLSGRRMGIPTGGSDWSSHRPLGKSTGWIGPSECSLVRWTPFRLQRATVHKPLYTEARSWIRDSHRQGGPTPSATIARKKLLAIDAVINQRGQGALCLCLVGQKRSSVVDTIETLQQYGALACRWREATRGLKFLAPFMDVP